MQSALLLLLTLALVVPLHPEPAIETASFQQQTPSQQTTPQQAPPRPSVEDADFKIISDRWKTQFPSDPRRDEGNALNPYRQNILKGDYPVIGQHTFLNITLASETSLTLRRLPVPQDVSSFRPGSFEFFGRGRQEAVNQNFIYSFDLFHGDTSYKPVDWRFKVTGITNINYLRARELGIVNIDVRKGTDRNDNFSAVEDAFFEVRLGDTTTLFPFLRGSGGKGWTVTLL